MHIQAIERIGIDYTGKLITQTALQKAHHQILLRVVRIKPPAECWDRGRNAFQAIKEWNQLYGETHNPDGSPKGVENPMKPPKDYQPMGVCRRREVPSR
jgi:hypothetical protein